MVFLDLFAFVLIWAVKELFLSITHHKIIYRLKGESAWEKSFLIQFVHDETKGSKCRVVEEAEIEASSLGKPYLIRTHTIRMKILEHLFAALAVM